VADPPGAIGGKKMAGKYRQIAATSGENNTAKSHSKEMK
jgi:hypothetical protein